jgi:hypothetical protein
MGSSLSRDEDDILDMVASRTDRKLGDWGNNVMPNGAFFIARWPGYWAYWLYRVSHTQVTLCQWYNFNTTVG